MSFLGMSFALALCLTGFAADLPEARLVEGLSEEVQNTLRGKSLAIANAILEENGYVPLLAGPGLLPIHVRREIEACGVTELTPQSTFSTTEDVESFFRGIHRPRVYAVFEDSVVACIVVDTRPDRDQGIGGADNPITEEDKDRLMSSGELEGLNERIALEWIMERGGYTTRHDGRIVDRNGIDDRWPYWIANLGFYPAGRRPNGRKLQVQILFDADPDGIIRACEIDTLFIDQQDDE